MACGGGEEDKCHRSIWSQKAHHTISVAGETDHSHEAHWMNSIYIMINTTTNMSATGRMVEDCHADLGGTIEYSSTIIE